MTYFGMVIQQELRNRNKSHEWLAKQVGCTRYYISGLLSGTFDFPSTKYIFKICKVLDLDYFQMCVTTGKVPKYLYQALGLDFEELSFVVHKWKELDTESRDKILNFMWKKVENKEEYEKEKGKDRTRIRLAERLKKSYFKSGLSRK